jgi:hypothetical protein
MKKWISLLLLIIIVRVYVPFNPPPKEFRVNSLSDIVKITERHFMIKDVDGKERHFYANFTIITEEIK